MKDYTTNRLITIDEELQRVKKHYKVTEDVKEKKSLYERAQNLDTQRKFLEGVLERRRV